MEKKQPRWQDFYDIIISLYARGISVCKVQQHLNDLYHTEVYLTLISAVTGEVDNRPLKNVFS
ncbi:transposase [Desulfovibrio intestinalis]|uniref:Transposase-like protein n=1 Tax=Desulfovibrio intestinalis TaxID=58621 RepID=A0A7W8C5F5_9BACT|nr:transposase-like protein [Desulfovibrio intestinalis]